jgi:hypothetical protein
MQSGVQWVRMQFTCLAAFQQDLVRRPRTSFSTSFSTRLSASSENEGPLRDMSLILTYLLVHGEEGEDEVTSVQPDEADPTEHQHMGSGSEHEPGNKRGSACWYARGIGWCNSVTQSYHRAGGGFCFY